MGNNNYYRNKRKGNGGNRPSQSAPNNDSAPLNTTPIEELKLSETTERLLLTGNVKIVSDLTRRTEKDMYRIQNLNKRVLMEIKAALQKIGEDFSPSEASKLREQDDATRATSQRSENRQCDRQQRAPQNGDRQQRPSQGGDRQQRNSQGERQQQRNQQGAPQKQPQHGQKSEQRGTEQSKGKKDQSRAAKPVKEQVQRLTAPLEFPNWRKYERNKKWGFSDGFKVVIEPKFDEVWLFKEDLACVELDEKCGYIDKTGEIVIPCTYDTAMSFSEGFANVANNNSWGYINKNNEQVIAMQFEAATPFEGGKARVKQDGKWGYLFTDGTISYSKLK